MLKSVEKLIHAANTGRKSAKCGNHSMQVKDGVIRYYYYSTAVCTVGNGKVVYDDGGYTGYSSTTRTLNSYKAYYGV